MNRSRARQSRRLELHGRACNFLLRQTRTPLASPARHCTRRAAIPCRRFTAANLRSISLGLVSSARCKDRYDSGICILSAASAIAAKYSSAANPLHEPWVRHSCWIKPGSGMNGNICSTISRETGLTGAQFSRSRLVSRSGHNPCTTKPILRPAPHSPAERLVVSCAQKAGAHDRAST
jgi:hypothetical protein